MEGWLRFPFGLHDWKIPFPSSGCLWGFFLVHLPLGMMSLWPISLGPSWEGTHGKARNIHRDLDCFHKWICPESFGWSSAWIGGSLARRSSHLLRGCVVVWPPLRHKDMFTHDQFSLTEPVINLDQWFPTPWEIIRCAVGYYPSSLFFILSF